MVARMPVQRVNDRPVPRVVGGRPNATPPAGGYPPPTQGDGSYAGGQAPIETDRSRQALTISGGPERGRDGQSPAAQTVGQQTAQQNVAGATPFMQTPGMQIASQRVSGQDVQNDPAISAALQDFYNRTAPQIQNRATTSGLGRSTAALNAMNQAQASMLAPMYEASFGREQTRLGNLNTAAENELGRQERSAGRVADANQNMAQLLMQMSGQQFNQQQGAGQNIMQAGGQLRDISQQGNEAALNDFLRRQALGEQAVYAPFGGLAQGGLGSSTSSTGK